MSCEVEAEGALAAPDGGLRPTESPKERARAAKERAKALATKFEGMVTEQVVLGGIMGAENVLKSPQVREKIAEECKLAVSSLDLFELLALKGRPCSATTRSHIDAALRMPLPHDVEQVKAVQAAENQLGALVADAMDYSVLNKLHAGLEGMDSLVVAFDLESRGQDAQSEVPVVDVHGANRTGQRLQRSRQAKSCKVSHHQPYQDTETSHQWAPKKLNSGKDPSLADDAASNSCARQRTSIEHTSSQHWSMWSMWADTYVASRPSRRLCSERSHAVSREETMSAAKSVYRLERSAAPGSPGRRRRYFKQTDSATIQGFPEQPAESRAVSARERKLPPAEVVGSWQWGRQQLRRAPTDSKVSPLARPAFAQATHRTAEEAVSAALGTQWREHRRFLLQAAADVGETTLRGIGNFPAANPPNADATVAAKESLLRDTAGQLDGYRYEALAQLIAENARLAELSPRTQRRLCKLKPLRLTD